MTIRLGHPVCAARVLAAAVLYCLSLSAPATTVGDLQAARDNLGAARAALASAAGEFTTLLADNSLSQTEKKDFLFYLDRLKQVVQEKCREVLTVKAALEDNTPERGCNQVVMSPPEVSFPSEQTEDERVAALENQLRSSMSEFDELLLRQMEELERQRSTASSGSAGTDAAEDGGQQGGTSGGAGEKPAQDESAQEGTKEEGGGEAQGQQQTAARDAPGEQQQGGTRGGQSKEQAGSAVRRDDPPAAGDDDIVARQLREAAENEADPELREKLWEEYRRYKEDNAVSKSN